MNLTKKYRPSTDKDELVQSFRPGEVGGGREADAAVRVVPVPTAGEAESSALPAVSALDAAEAGLVDADKDHVRRLRWCLAAGRAFVADPSPANRQRAFAAAQFTTHEVVGSAEKVAAVHWMSPTASLYETQARAARAVVAAVYSALYPSTTASETVR